MADYPRSWRVNKRAALTNAVQPPNGRAWYRIHADASNADISIYDEIGYWGTNAADFTADLNKITARHINVHINSPGGEVFDGVAIYQALRRHPASITTYIDGLAASIASVIAMAGDRRIIGRNATMMIHEASGLCMGEAKDMRELADLLDRQSDNIADVYASRTGRGTTASWRDLMRAETWLIGPEAVEAGLATEVSEDVEGDWQAVTARLLQTPKGSAEWTALVANLRPGGSR